MRYKKLVEDIQKYPNETRAGLSAALRERTINPASVDLTELFIECVGWGAFTNMRANSHVTPAQVFREAGAVMTTAFQNISQQFLSEIFMQAYDIPERVFMKIIPVVPTKKKFDRRAGISHVGDEAQVVDEGKNYPLVGVSEDWFDTPEVKKRGNVVRVTKETIIFDETNRVVEQIQFLGDWLGVNHEKRAIDATIDENVTQHRYNWQGNVIASYGDNSGTHNWDNLSASTDLVDYKSLDTAYQLLEQITDPQTGEPQNVSGKHLIVARDRFSAAHIATAPMVRPATPGFATSANPVQTMINNPVLAANGGAPQIICTPLLKARMATDTTWYFGDIAKAVEYREVWPVTFDQLGDSTQLAFDADVVSQYKASSMGAFGVKNPRALVKCTA